MDLTSLPSHSPYSRDLTAESIAQIELLGTVSNATIDVLVVEEEAPAREISLPAIKEAQPTILQPTQELMFPT